MTEKDAWDKIEYLRELKIIYTSMYDDPTSTLFKSRDIRELIKKTNSDIIILEDLIYNGDLRNEEADKNL